MKETEEIRSFIGEEAQNQRVIDVQKSLAKGEAVLYCD